MDVILILGPNYISWSTTDLKVRAEKAELALRELERVWKATNEDLLKRVELLSKEKDEKEDEHVAEIAEVIVEVKGSVAMAIWEAKNKLAEDVANAGSWNVADWHEALAKLTGEPVNIVQDHVR